MLRIPAPFGRIATRGLPAAAAVSMLALAAPGAPAAVQQAGAVAQPLLSGPILTGKQRPAAPISTTDCQSHRSAATRRCSTGTRTTSTRCTTPGSPAGAGPS